MTLSREWKDDTQNKKIFFCKSCTDKRLISRIYKKLLYLKTKKTIIYFKNVQKTCIDISPKKIYKCSTNT